MPKTPAKSKSAVTSVPAPLRPQIEAAGMRLLAAGTPASRLDAKNVAAEAKLKPAQIKAAFPKWEDYLMRLLRTLSEEVRLEAVMAIAKKTPGRALIREGIQNYLDVVLSRPALLEITAAHRGHPVCQQITRDRVSSLVMLATLQLKMAEVKNAEGISRLGMAMLFEITYAEYEARRSLPDYRHTIDSYFAST